MSACKNRTNSPLGKPAISASLGFILSYFALFAAMGENEFHVVKLVWIAIALILIPALFPKVYFGAAWLATAAVVVFLGLAPFSDLTFIAISLVTIVALGKLRVNVQFGMAFVVGVLSAVPICISQLIRPERGLVSSLSHLLNGIVDPDVLYHESIVTMILREHIPSTGLHFAPYFPYQYFPHALLAGISGLLGVMPYEIYFGFVPLFVFPLIWPLVSAAAVQTGTSLTSVAIIPCLLLGICLDSSELRGLGWDPSTIFGWACLWATIPMLKRSSLVPLTLFLPVVGLLKVPSLITLTGLILFLCIFDVERTWRNRVTSVLSTMFFAGIGYLAFIPKTSDQPMRMVFWSYQQVVPDHGVIHYLWETSHFIILLWVFFLFLPKFRVWLDRSDRLILAYATLLTLLFNNIAMAGNNQGYFILGANWLCLPLLAQFIIKALAEPAWNREKRVVAVLLGIQALVVATFVGLHLGEFSASARSIEARREQLNRHYHRDNADQKLSFEAAGRYLNALAVLGKAPIKPEHSLVEIPSSELFWRTHFPWPYERYWLPFYIPVLSGKPAFRGYDPKSMKEANVGWLPPGYHSYYIYYPLSDDACQSTRYRSRYLLTLMAENVVTSEISCPPR